MIVKLKIKKTREKILKDSQKLKYASLAEVMLLRWPCFIHWFYCKLLHGMFVRSRTLLLRCVVTKQFMV